MAFILPVNGIEPYLGKNTFVAPNATIVGDVICGEDCSFWFNAVVRGDVNSIRLGNKVNIQGVLRFLMERTFTFVERGILESNN